MKNIVRIKVLSCDRKLQLVKIVKSYSGLGLYESKKLCDEIFLYNDKYHEIELLKTSDYNKSFLYELEFLGRENYSVSIGSPQWNREFKLLKLGISEDKGEYIDLINQLSEDNTLKDDIYEFMLNNLSKDGLVETMQFINNKIF